jgi:hypothetical protein
LGVEDPQGFSGYRIPHELGDKKLRINREAALAAQQQPQ